MPGGKEDERFKNRINQLLKDEWLLPKYRLEEKSEFVQIQIIRTESERLTNTTGTPVDNKRIPKGCDVFEDQEAQLGLELDTTNLRNSPPPGSRMHKKL
jgi:hypothetical protein